MKFKARRLYILTVFISVFILLAVGFVKYLSPARKTSAAFKKPKPALSAYVSVTPKSLKLPICKDETVFACTVKYLQYLRYLPVSYAGHDVYKFSFPVPDILYSIADSYTWNSKNPFILGAAAQYLEASGKISDGEYARPQINGVLLSELKKSAAKGKFDMLPWKWVLVKQAKKGEKVELYENGRAIFSSPVNTGEFTTTPDGTWYIFLRFHDTSMSGLSPKRISKKVYETLKAKHSNAVGCLDGHRIKWVPYDDSGIKYVDYFNKGIALHYISRARFGFPQSAGCVEIPLRAARFLYKNTGYGTIVTVIGFAGNAAAKKHRVKEGSTAETCVE
jgi:hypothetical protein